MKKLINEIKGLYNEQKLVGKFICGFLGVFFAFFFFTFMYRDITITTKHAIQIWTDLFSGRILHFYQDSMLPLVSSVSPDANFSGIAAYDFPVFIVFAIWNFPLWIADSFFRVDIFQSFFALMWIKSMLLIFLGYATYMVYKIAVEINIKREHIFPAVFIFLSSTIVLSSVFLLSQYDIICLSFSLTGIYHYIKGDWKKFLFYFMIAVTFKLFALLIFVPLVFLKEKRVFHCIGAILSVFSLLLLFRLPFYLFDSGFNEAMSVMGWQTNRLFTHRLPLGHSGIYVFVLSYILICIYSYSVNCKTKSDLNRNAIYFPCLAMSCCYLTAPSHPFWIVLIAPYIPLIIFQNYSRFRINMILDICYSFGLICSQMVIYYWCFEAHNFKDLVLEWIIVPVEKLKQTVSPKDVIDRFFVSDPLNSPFGVLESGVFFTTIFIACLAAFLFLNRPDNSVDNTIESVREYRTLIWLRLICGVFLLLLPFILYIYSYIRYGVI